MSLGKQTIFISHASKDDYFVKELRLALESHRIVVWVDSRELIGGKKLAPEINEAIEHTRQFVVVLSPNTIDSPSVGKEIQKALDVERERKDDGYRVIALLLPGIEPSDLARWFDEEPIGVKIELKAGALNKALPQILAALGERPPDDKQAIQEADARPVAELKLKLKGASLVEVGEGRWRVKATAQLIYAPAARTTADSREFPFTAPLGPIEADDLRWYLEGYYLWPTGVFTERAKHIEEKLPQWGKELYDAATAPQSARDLLADWRVTADVVERRFSIFVDDRSAEGSSDEEQAAANEAASALLTLPWELMHDGRTFLFQGKNPVCVRRCLPKELPEKAMVSSLPIRILLLSPRPEDDLAGYIDHRLSARPLVDAVESLGELAELTILNPPTLPALQQALRKAADGGKPFDVIHFDGHGVYNRQRWLGALCFEDPEDSDKTEKRKSQLIDAEKLAGVVREHRIQLVFLEACQSASEERPTASVAAKLLDQGVTSVVAMTHSVLVETSRRFVTTFYRELAEGKRIGTAMLAGQNALHDDDFRIRVMGAGELRLQDWFVPVLYQNETDPQLVTRLLPEQVRILHDNRRRLSLGALPEPPAHSFIGRSREMLALERLLQTQTPTDLSYAVVRGQGGEGKTTLAVELARWMVRTNRFRRAAFVSLEYYPDARGVLDSLGRQLLSEGDQYSVAQYHDLKEALQPVERALSDQPTLIVLDNVESVLSGPTNSSLSRSSESDPSAEQRQTEVCRTSPAEIDETFDLCRTLLHAHPATRIVFTSREPLPAPFDHKHREIGLGALNRDDAILLVSRVMEREGLKPKLDDAGNTPQQITELVEAVNRHARALVLLTPEIGRSGVRATTENLHRLMAELHQQHPDDPERSLYASAELSLHRLPPELREHVRVLGVFHAGAHLMVLHHVLDMDAVDVETVQKLAAALVEVGLAEEMPYGHLRLDPALPSYLLGQMSSAEQELARLRWAEGMRGLTAFLNEQRFQDAQLAAQLTLLELPNLRALLTWAQDTLTPEEVVGLAGSLESLLSYLGRPQALAQATRAREQAAQRLGEWSHAQFESSRLGIDRMLEQGRLPETQAAAEQLLQRALAAGETAYAEAAYDIAVAHFLWGKVLKTIGAAEAALQSLREAQLRFQTLVDAGNANAQRIVSVAITEAAASLTDLGRYDEAAAGYEEGIRRAEEFGDRREAALGRANLGTVRLHQKRYAEALESCREALRVFESMGEPRSVAVLWHQIGMAHRYAGPFAQAELAYRQSLAIRVQQQDRVGEAASLGELGNLYDQMGRLEEAATFYRRAADIAVQLQDRMREGRARSNLANTLIKLRRYNEARGELFRAVECNQPFGHAAERWKTWDILRDLEQATGNAQAAEAARGQATASYVAYRRAGGESQSNVAQLFALVLQANQEGATTEAEQYLNEWLKEDDPLWAKALVAELRAVLRGERDPALAVHPTLDYVNAAELQLLMEVLQSWTKKKSGTQGTESLSPAEQETLIDILRHRTPEKSRQRLIREVEQARRDFGEGQCPEATVDEIMQEIIS